jgi:hypothetical protein
VLAPAFDFATRFERVQLVDHSDWDTIELHVAVVKSRDHDAAMMRVVIFLS